MNFSIADIAAANISDPFWLPIAEALIKATLILSAAGVASAVLRRASASLRHLIWTLALVGALLLPLLSWALPRWQFPIVTLASSSAAPVPLESTSPIIPRPITRGARTVGAGTAPAATVPMAAQDVTKPGSGARGPGAREPEPRTRPAPWTPAPGPRPQAFWRVPDVSWPTLIATIWLAGALMILGRLAVGVIAVHWMSRRTARVTDAPWLPLARQLASDMGVRRLTFGRSPRATMPMAWGMFHPSVLMPADADVWPIERLRIVLLHELAHVKRRDCLTHALAQVTCAIYWFNPLVWVAMRQARRERERACDDLVLSAGTHGPDYADQLLEVARAMRAGRFPALFAGATLAMAHRSQLEGRLMAILDPNVPRAGLTRVRMTAATTVLACAIVPLASLQPWAHADAPAVGAAVSEVEHTPPAAEPQKPASRAPSPSPEPRLPSPDVRVPNLESSPLTAMPTAPQIAQAVAGAVADVASSGVVQSAVEAAAQGTVESLLNVAPLSGQRNQTEEAGRQKADPRVLAALTAALKDTDKEVREHAMHALVQLRDPAVYEPLVQALGDASADIREQAVMGLGRLRDRRALEVLVRALKDQNPSVREQAVSAVGQFRDPATFDALAQALKDENASVREQAAFALGQIRDARAVDTLMTAAKDSNPSVREQAVFALGQIHDRRAVPALSAAVSDENPSVREQAVFALGQLRDPSSVDGLTTALRDAHPDVREQAAFALGQLRDKRAVEPLISALKDGDADVREQAAFALGQLRERGAVEALVIALKDSDADVREQAAFALGQLRDPRAIDALTAALTDKDASVRQQAAFALGQLAR